jgi:hypothetical protein
MLRLHAFSVVNHRSKVQISSARVHTDDRPIDDALCYSWQYENENESTEENGNKNELGEMALLCSARKPRRSDASGISHTTANKSEGRTLREALCGVNLIPTYLSSSNCYAARMQMHVFARTNATY